MRLGSSLRSAGGEDLLQIVALVPKQAGWTLQAQPVLYWYLPARTDAAIRFEIIRVGATKPLLRTRLPRPRRAGLQRIRLADFGVGIQSGEPYQWFVSIIPDPEQRAGDLMTGGGVERVEPHEELQAALRNAAPERIPHLLAQAGIWYDTVDLLLRWIEARPEGAALRKLRAALFEQVGLPPLPLDASAS